MLDGWIETTLGEVSESSWGNTEITKSKYVPTGFLAFSASGADGFLDWFEHDTSAVILSAIGAQCGKTWFASGKWTAIKNTIWLKSNGVSLSDKYLFYLSNTEHFWQIRGQAQPFISLGDVKKKKLMLPPLAEQKRIVDLISSVDSYVEALQQQVDKARKSRNAVLHELITKGGDGWVDFKFKDVAKVLKGKLPKGKNELGIGLPYLTANYLRSNSADFWIENLEGAVIAEQGECLILWDGAGAGDLFQAQNGVVSSTMAVVKSVNDSIFRDFLTLLISTKADYIKETCRGTTVPHVSPDAIENMNLIIPPLAEQKRIVEIISVFDNQIEALDSTIAKTKNLRSALLSDLLSGNHEIPPNYDKLIGAA